MKKFPLWGILILADIRPMGISFYGVVVFGQGKNILFKSMLGRCANQHFVFVGQKRKKKKRW